MRADIHDGPEHMLQSETEYIDARPRQPASTKASCTARPDHTFGSFATELGVPRHVRFTPVSDRIADIAGGPFRAKSGSLPPTVRTACYAPSVHVGAAGTSPSWHNPYKD